MGTRTLKVTAWLSGAMVTASMSCYASNLWGIEAGAAYKDHVVSIAFGCVTYFYDDPYGRHAYLTGSSPIWIYAVDQPASSVLREQWPSVRSWWVKMPLWIPAIVALAIGTPAFVALRRRAHAIKSGACPHCGYMLTGIDPAAPCPECGRAKAAHG